MIIISILIDEKGIDAHGADYKIGFIPLLRDRYKIPQSSTKYSLPLYFNFNLSENKSIFEFDYNALKERCSTYKEELIQVALHPSRIQKLLEQGISFEELDNYI